MLLFLSSFLFSFLRLLLFQFHPNVAEANTASHSWRPNERQYSHKTKFNKAHIRINKAKNIINPNRTLLITSQCITLLAGYHIDDLAVSLCLVRLNQPSVVCRS